MIIDTHAHLTSGVYNGELPLDGFSAIGGRIVIDVAYDYKSCEKVVENANKLDMVYCAVGVHPDEADISQDYEAIKRLALNERCVAIGEAGLDYHKDLFDKKKQRFLFERQIALADELKLPLIIHSRDASCDMLDILKNNKDLLKQGFLMHCYSESAEQAENYLKLGGYFAFGGAITFRNSKRGEILKKLPSDRILFETDCPYMTPVPFRGRINKPEYVKLVYEYAAAALNMKMDELESTVCDNFHRLFKKVPQ